MTRRHYLAEDIARIAGLAASGLTHKQIAAEVGIPRRTITNIVSRTPVAMVVTAATKEQVSAALWSVVAAGTAEALRRISDPSTRAGELAQLIKVAADQHALLNGGPTENINVQQADVTTYHPLGLGPESRAFMVDYLRTLEAASDEELSEVPANLLVVMENVHRLVTDDDYERKQTHARHGPGVREWLMDETDALDAGEPDVGGLLDTVMVDQLLLEPES